MKYCRKGKHFYTLSSIELHTRFVNVADSKYIEQNQSFHDFHLFITLYTIATVHSEDARLHPVKSYENNSLSVFISAARRIEHAHAKLYKYANN